MTYYKDLTLYEFLVRDENSEVPVLNIGWLSGDQPFEAGVTSREFRNNLFQFCSSKNLVMLTRGFHVCEFCSLHDTEEEEPFGNGEIRIQGNSVLYAAPALISHYVVQHNYKPPQEFIDAVLTGPQPGSEEYSALLDNYK